MSSPSEVRDVESPNDKSKTWLPFSIAGAALALANLYFLGLWDELQDHSFGYFRDVPFQTWTVLGWAALDLLLLALFFWPLLIAVEHVRQPVLRRLSCVVLLAIVLVGLDDVRVQGLHFYGECILCHQPQTSDPDTGNTVDFPVMVHKIQMGEELPSVVAGKPYQIIGNNQSVNDYSTVVDPADVRRCEVCHDPKSGAAQAASYLTKPTRVACGACHDDVNFATGANHAGGPQISDNQCAICHIPQGELDFDASIKGAHLVPQDSSSLKGLVFVIQKVENGLAGQKPKVTFTVKDNSGAAVPLSSLNNLSFLMSGPTTDYGNTSFGSDVTTVGYVSESATTAAQCGSDGVCTYTFTHAVPAGAKGTFAIGMEGRRTEILLPGTVTETSVQYGGDNKVTYFSVDGSPILPRRQVVQIANCNQCHVDLTLHGSNRNDVEMCIFCHNPSNTDAAQRPNATDPAERTKPPQGINSNLLIHRIHTGENLKDAGKNYTVIGRNGSINDFTHVRFPLMSPQGGPGDTRNCAKCHINDSQANPGGVNDVRDPQGYINPAKPISAACIGCHVTSAASSHMLGNTTSIGESCAVCHSSGSVFDVDKMHAQL